MAESNFQLGPCKIEYGGEDLGNTNGGVTVTIEESYASLTTDQNGENPVDEQCTGTSVTVEGALADITLDNIASLFKTTVVGTAGSAQKVEIKANVGTSLLANSNEMVIKPYVNGTVTTDPNDYITIHNAGFKASASMAYNATDQRVINFTATGYPNADGVIVTFGDVTATA